MILLLEASSSLPAAMLCKVAQDDEASPQTFEIRLECPVADQPLLVAGLRRYGRNRIIDDGLLNVAIVTGFGDTLYFIVTDGRDQRSDNAYRAWVAAMKKVTCSNLRKLPEIAQIKCVRPFTRYSQRRFGWGDAQATREEVVAAVNGDDSAKLLAIMPEARPLVRYGELEHIPAIFDALRAGPPAALADCRHQFLTERGMLEVQGPCLECGTEASVMYKQGFTKCASCETVRCKPCAGRFATEQDGQQAFLRAYHEVKNGHTWVASQEDCDLCGKGPCGCGIKHCDACKADLRTMQCECGIYRCTKCLHVHAWSDVNSDESHKNPGAESTNAAPAQPGASVLLALPSTSTRCQTEAASSQAPPAQQKVRCTMCSNLACKVCSCGEARCEACLIAAGGSLVETWYEAHPQNRPATCYIANLSRMRREVQLEWITLELGEGAGLVAFARKFRELAGERLGGNSQKDFCLKLYRQYAKIATRNDLKQGPYASEKEAHKKLAQKMLYSMRAQMPPEELEEFEKLWDEGAPRRCHDCNCPLPANTGSGQLFCEQHADASRRITCGRVVERTVVPESPRLPEEKVIRRCDGKVDTVGGFRGCTKCGRDADIAETCAGRLDRAAETELEESRKRSAKSLQIANNVWFFGTEVDPNHVPAWTKRRRL